MLVNTQTNKRKEQKSRWKPRLTYHNSEFCGYAINEKFISPEEMLQIYNDYETSLRREKFEYVKRTEIKNNYPSTWLNHVISVLISEGNGLSRLLIDEFRDRGFGSLALKFKNGEA